MYAKGLQVGGGNNFAGMISPGKILLPSAVHLEERLTVSQAAPEPGQQSVRSNTQFGFFCQWQTRAQAVGTPLAPQ